MGLDIWFAEDVQRALRAAELASKSTARAMERNGVSEPEVQYYRQGYRDAYRDALDVIAAAFGCAEDEHSEPIRMVTPRRAAPATMIYC